MGDDDEVPPANPESRTGGEHGGDASDRRVSGPARVIATPLGPIDLDRTEDLGRLVRHLMSSLEEIKSLVQSAGRG